MSPSSALGIGLDVTPHTLRHKVCKELVNAGGEGLLKVAALARQT